MAARDRVVWMPGGVRTELPLIGEETAGQLCMLVDRPPPGWSLPPHRHLTESETIHIVEGQFEMEIDGRLVSLVAGDTVHVPKGAVHSGGNVGEGPGRRVVMFTPAGIERFFLETGAPEPDVEIDADALVASAVRHGWEFVSG